MRWYVVGMEAFLGVMVILQAQFLADPIQTFAGYRGYEKLNRRIIAALQRRRSAENIGAKPWYLFGLCALSLALASAVQILPTLLNYLSLYVAAAAIFAVTLLRMRNKTDRRAAALAPREPITRLVPRWLLAISLIGTLAPLVLIRTQGIGIVALFVTIVGLLLVVLAFVLGNEMPAMLTGEDPPVEILVETLMRRRRVSRVLMLAVASATYFIFITTRSGQAIGSSILAAAIVSATALFTLAGWELYCRAQVPRVLGSTTDG